MQTETVSSNWMSLTGAALSLKALRRPRLSDMSESLVRLLNFGRYAKILRELNETQFYHAAGEGVRICEIPESESHPIEDAAMAEIENLFPQSYESENQFSDIGEHSLWIEPQMFPYGWDSWDEAIANPEEMGDSESIYVFCKSLCLGMDSDMWCDLSSRFGWNCAPVYLDGTGDSDRLFERLEQAGLGDWPLMFKICFADTGNAFIDYDEQDPPSWPLSIESVRELHEEYQDSLEISAAYHRVLAATQEDPGIFTRVAKIFSKNLVRTARVRTNGAVTLAELWAGEGDEDGDAVIDPFYGPIG